ncbi:penicillin acylase family protein [Pseudomonadales bacterium]|nr:penicillin acylase family protein [Pseudomonadales bacterium]
MQPYDDDLPSLAFGFGSGRWAALASYGAKRFAGTEKRYGASGNRFVAMVEFGETPRAKSLLAGEQSGDPRSPHCFDQARLYTQGRFKDVAYYREGVLARAQSIYQPGAESATDPEAGHARQQGLQSD